MAGRWVDVGEAPRELGISTALLSVSAASVTAKQRCSCSYRFAYRVDSMPPMSYIANR
jgi:hypothetical protein